MKPSNTIVVSPKYIEEKEHQIADLSKKVARLQEQLKEANEVIKEYMALGKWYDFYNEGPGMVADDMQKYLEKWGVK